MGWFRKKSKRAVDSAAAAESIYEAFAAHGRGDYATALRLLRPLAIQGHATAQYNLGNMYMDGQGVPQNNAEAVKWFHRAAVQGFIDAQANLGAMYIDGRGVAQNYAEALRWLRPAADKGDREAQSCLGNMYSQGNGVQPSIAEAMKWYRRAADQGLTVAQFNVGFGYASGQGVSQDEVTAHMWFNLSAAQGSRDAATNRDIIEQIMTPAQIAEAKKLAREWRPKPERHEMNPFHLNTTREERRAWFAHTPPWDQLDSTVIDAILDGITDKLLLEAFVRISMIASLVARYEPLGGERESPTVIRAQVSHILCQTGNRAIHSLAKAMEAQQKDAMQKAVMLAADTFEPAIALAKNQIAAYAGMASLCGMVGKRSESQDWARRGLIELEETRRDPASRALRDSTIFPADILDQMERQLRTLLASM